MNITIHAIGPQKRSPDKIKLIGALCILSLGGFLVAENFIPQKVPTEGLVSQATINQGGSGTLYVDVTSGPYKDYAISVEVLAYEAKPKVGSKIEFDLQKGLITGTLRGSGPRLKH